MIGIYLMINEKCKIQNIIYNFTTKIQSGILKNVIYDNQRHT